MLDVIVDKGIVVDIELDLLDTKRTRMNGWIRSWYHSM